MIRAVGNKRVDLSDSEYEYYKELIKHVEPSEFNGIFESNENGIILNVMPRPDRNSSLIVYFFLMNVSFNQRLRKLDEFLSYRDKVDELISKVENIESKIK